MKTRKKLKSNAGFTLAETLLAVLILLLVSTIVATGMPTARNAYEKVVVAANAQVLLSTAATALRDELGTAWEVKIDDDPDVAEGSFITYFSSDTGGKSKIFLNNDDNKIYIQEYVTNQYFNEDVDKSVGEERPLVSDKAANGDLIITYEKIKRNDADSSAVISGLTVVNKNGKEMAKLEAELIIPVLTFAPNSAS